MIALLETDWLSEPIFETPSDPIAQLISVICAQHEGPANGWWDIWCVEEEGHHEIFEGSLTAFAELLNELGWCVESMENFSAICKTCSNAPDTSHYASQFEDERGLLG